MFKLKGDLALKGKKHLKFDFGCGQSKEKGFLGVDVHDYGCVDVVSDLDGFKKIPNGCAGRISSCHFIEHLELNQALYVLREWKRMLGGKGIMKVYFPDMGKVNPATNSKIAMNHAWGARKNELDYHKSYWTADLMVMMLKEVGYHDVKIIPYFGTLHPNKGDMAWTSGVEGIKR